MSLFALKCSQNNSNMKTALIVLLAILFVAVIVVVAFFGVWLAIKLDKPKMFCKDCVYLKKGKCTHWDEERTPSMGACEALKKRKV